MYYIVLCCIIAAVHQVDVVRQHPSSVRHRAVRTAFRMGRTDVVQSSPLFFRTARSPVLVWWGTGRTAVDGMDGRLRQFYEVFRQAGFIHVLVV